MHDPDKPEGADDLLAAARRRILEVLEALRRPKHGTYFVRDKGDGRALERLDAAEAKRARRRERNLRNQRAQQYGGF